MISFQDRQENRGDLSVVWGQVNAKDRQLLYGREAARLS